MKHKYFLPLFFACFLLISTIALTAPIFSVNTFLTPSATIAGSTTVCQNSAMPIVTFTGSGGSAPYTFEYTINNGSTLTISTTDSDNSVSIPVNTGTSGTFTYTLVGVSDSVDIDIETQSGSAVIAVQPTPDTSMGGTGSGSVYEGVSVFRVCMNTSSLFNFTNTSSTQGGLNTNYTIDWGDGSPNFSGNSWSVLSHTYDVGLWNVVYTVEGNNGCSSTQNYIVFVGSNPAVSLGNPGNTDVCNTSSLTFPITGTENNPPGTTYTVTFNDGSESEIFNHPPPASVTHTFLTSSCGIDSSDGTNTYANSFSANILAANPCSSSSVGVVPIYVSTAPEANFDSPEIACINTSVCLTNQSIGDTNTGSSSACDTTPNIIWSISPDIGFTISSGSLGNDFGLTDASSWFSGSDELCLNFTEEGTYTITQNVGNTCGFDTIEQTICIESPLTPIFNLDEISVCGPDEVNAINTTVESLSCSDITYLWDVDYTSDFCNSSTTGSWGFINGTDSNTTNASFNFITPGVYTVSLTVSNSCGDVTTTQNVNVKQPPKVEINPIADVCNTFNISPEAIISECTDNGSSLSYDWSFVGATPTTSNLENPGDIVYASPGTYTITLQITNDCGVSEITTETFTIKETPVITNTNFSQIICSGSYTDAIDLTASVVGTTFSWTAVGTTGVSGFITSGTSNAIAAQLINTTSTIPGTVTYTVIPTAESCIGDAIDFVITVNPAPQIVTQPQSSSVCQNGTVTILEVSLSSTSDTPTYQWYSNTFNSTTGGVLIPGATASTYQPLTDTVGIVYYYCEVSFSSEGCSLLTSEIAAVEVTENATIVTQPMASQTLCVGGTTDTALQVEYTGGNGTVTYQWYSNTSNSATGGIVISGGTNSTYTPDAFLMAGTYYFYVELNFNISGCDNVVSEVAEVIVSERPVIDVQPIITQTLCQTAIPQNLEVEVSGGVGTFSYQWYRNILNTSTGGTIIPGATNSTYVPSTNNVGTLYYYCVVSQSVNSSCTVVSATSEVIVNEAPSFVNQPASQALCLGATVTDLEMTYANGVGTATLQWYSNTTNDTTTGTEIAGATNNIYSPDVSIIGTTYYYGIITFSEGGCTEIISNIAEIIVSETPEIITQAIATQTLCQSITPQDLEVEVSGTTGVFSYQWYSNTVNNTSAGTLISGATSEIYTPLTDVIGTTYYYVEIYNTLNSTCKVVSEISEVIVNEAPAFVNQPSSQALCLGATVTDLEMTYTNGVGTATLQWYSNTTADSTTGVEITGETSTTYTPDVSVAGTTYYYGIITFSEGGCTEIISDIAEISVSETPEIITQAIATQTLCQSITPQDLEVEVSGTTGVFSYQWYSNTVNNTSAGTLISGATSEIYTPLTDVIGTTYYYVEIYNTLNSTCKVVSEISEVIVNEAPAFVNQPSSQALCLGATVTDLEMTYENGVGTATLQWYSNTTNDTTTGTEITGATNNIYSPDVSIIGTTYYYGIITFSEGGCSEIVSDIAEISVSEVPVIDTQALATQTLCESITATTLELTVSGGVDVFSYQWYSNGSNSTTGGTEISGATSETYTPEADAVGTTYYYVEIYNTLNDTCKVVSAISEVIVNEAPAFVEQPESEILCLGESASILEMSYINGVGVPDLQWYSNTVNSSIGGTIITGATSTTYSPDVSIVGTTYYYGVITFSEGGCTEIISDIAEIIVNDTPSIDDLAIVICSENVFTINPDATNGSSVPANTTYTWNMPTVSPLGSITGISEENIPQTEISQVLTNNTTSPAVVTYVVTPVSGLCIGEDFSIEVTVNPSISTEVVVVNNVCFESDSGSIAAVISGGVPFLTGDPYIINWVGPNGFVADTATISNLEPGDYALTVNDEGGCPLSETYTITEPEILAMVVDTETSISCYEADDAEITISVSGGTLDYTYNWTRDGVLFSADEDIYNLEPGTYEITISDANNCGPVIQTFLITEPDELEVSLASKDDVLCYGFSTGVINIITIGGTPIEVSPGVFDYNYEWVGANGFLSSSSDLTGLIAGAYQLTVTDANNCSDTLNVTLTQPDEIVINYTFTEITCYGAEDASINITSITGGAGGFDIAWNNFAEGLVQNNLSAGDYIITVTDADNCEMSTTIIIPEAPIFAISPDIEHVSCFGANDGSITLNFQGGQDPIDVIWDDDSTAGVERNNLAPGIYNLTISDGAPCYIHETFTILEPAILAIASNISNAFDCDDPNSGAINLIITGGTMPYTVNWSNGSTTEDLNNMPPGTYFVEVTDANGCEISDSYTIVRPSPIVVDVITETEADCDNANVTQTFVANVSGGVPPYQLNWSNGTVSGVNNEFMNTTQNGLVILEATDDLGCISSFTFEVDIPELSAADFQTTSIAYQTYGLYSMADPIEFFNTTSGDYESVFWDFGDGNFSSEENPTHIYTSEGPYVVTQTVTFPFGCVYTKIVTLIIEKGYKLIMPNAFSPNQDGINDYFTPAYIGLNTMELNIYDTWGSLIYTEANEDIQGWDGTVNGEPAENGNFYYTFTAKTFYGSKIKENGAFVSIK